MVHLSRIQRPTLSSSAALIALSLLSVGAAAQETSVSFFDDFNTFDRVRWYASDGWSNGPHQNCGWADKRVTLNDGILEIAFGPGEMAGRSFTCGEIRTRTAYKYGTYEARLKTPAGSGLNAAFFTYTGPTMNQPHDEIDFEVLAKDTGEISTGTYVSGKSGLGTPGNGNGRLLELPYASDSDFIQYGFVWAPDTIRFYANGELIRTIDVPHEIPTHEQNVFFSLWGSDTMTDWMGPFEAPAQPIKMELDWFGYTAPGESCLFPQSITC
ncbi:family 16 glycosylhydrolase [Devosia sp. SL43]|uniref:family 16 glycosylhydrolase n=1 Tax=Devosia sp. SL43 TaxID=2806348 RepID=UPI001F000913|nr:family 16 glycosylhydrolase [Devosia sp. SL43]UJW87442.1 family 16 glycosylhydrolase [Devosia sp. SL43]